MSLSLNESFVVNAPPDRVWRFLLDPVRVTVCLPGAELTDDLGDGAYGGCVKVKVGPIIALYTGTARLSVVDETEHRMQLLASGKDTAGGTAKMTMQGQVLPREDGASEVTVTARVDIAGRVMQFGRGMVESVTRRVFRDFAESVRCAIETPDAATIAADALTESLEQSGEAPGPERLSLEWRTMTATRPASSPQKVGLFRMLRLAVTDWFRRLRLTKKDEGRTPPQ